MQYKNNKEVWAQTTLQHKYVYGVPRRCAKIQHLCKSELKPISALSNLAERLSELLPLPIRRADKLPTKFKPYRRCWVKG